MFALLYLDLETIWKENFHVRKLLTFLDIVKFILFVRKEKQRQQNWFRVFYLLFVTFQS